MTGFVAAMLVVVAIIHLLPVSGMLGTVRLSKLYGLTFEEPNLEILMRHRAVLFGILGAFFAVAALRPELHHVALFVGFVSVIAFLGIARAVGGYNDAVRRVVVADLIALGCLTAAALASAVGIATAEIPQTQSVVAEKLPFSAAVRHGDTLYLSGQIGVLPGTMGLVEGGMEPESKQALANIRSVLESHGATTSDVVKCTVMLADISEWEAFNELYQRFFSKPYPARSAFGASGLALGARVEIECIAALKPGHE
jgi:2-iminobutanoate/2-iminopropanoate deaminase